MAKKRSKEELEVLKEHAKILYIKEGVNTQKELAARVGVTENTIGKWLAEGMWDKYKKNLLLTRQELLSDLLDEATAINKKIKDKPEGERFADAKQADARRKIIKDIKELEGKSSKPEAISACILLLDFIRKVSLEKAQLLAPYIDGFIKQLL